HRGRCRSPGPARARPRQVPFRRSQGIPTGEEPPPPCPKGYRLRSNAGPSPSSASDPREIVGHLPALRCRRLGGAAEGKHRTDPGAMIAAKTGGHLEFGKAEPPARTCQPPADAGNRQGASHDTHGSKPKVSPFRKTLLESLRSRHPCFQGRRPGLLRRRRRNLVRKSRRPLHPIKTDRHPYAECLELLDRVRFGERLPDR